MFTGNNGTVLLKNTSRKGRKENYHEVQEIVILLRVQLISNLFNIYHWNFKNASWKKKLDEVNAVF